MARKQRDYKAEYQRRKARGLARGLSVSQARGHPRAGETYASGKSSTPQPSEQLEAGLRAMRAGASLKVSAQAVGVSEVKLRRFVKGNGLARYNGREWELTDNRPRRVPIIRGSKQRSVVVPDFETASRVGTYYNMVGRFLDTNDPSVLAVFECEAIEDARGNTIPFETDPNTLYRYAARDEPPFHEIYQIVG